MAEKTALFSRKAPALFLILAALILDQATKIAADHFLPLQEPVDIIPFLSLFRTYNTGVAFSWFDDTSGTIIVAVRLAIVAFVLWLWANTSPSRSLSHLGFVLVIAGAAGNLVDRFLYGHVIDFILFHTESWSFAIFNLADSFITIGAFLLGYEEIFGRNEAKT